MSMQHINVKLNVESADGFDSTDLIPVFHAWIRESKLPGLLIDVADYRHVHRGPGVMLIAREGQYNLDEADGQLGLRYNRKLALDGDDSTRLGEALGRVLEAARLLAAQPVPRAAPGPTRVEMIR